MSSLSGAIEKKLDKADVVDPGAAAEAGKAADAKSTYEELNGILAKLAKKADKATTLEGYGITDAATKAELSVKADLVGGKVPAAQLPSYVDEVLEYGSKSEFPSSGESGRIYVAKDTNLVYRWSGTQYVEISPSPVLDGTVTETSSNGVKSSGVWSWVKSLLPKWLTSDYAEPATAASVADKADKATTYTKSETDAKIGGKRGLTDAAVWEKTWDFSWCSPSFMEFNWRIEIPQSSDQIGTLFDGDIAIANVDVDDRTDPRTAEIVYVFENLPPYYTSPGGCGIEVGKHFDAITSKLSRSFVHSPDATTSGIAAFDGKGKLKTATAGTDYQEPLSRDQLKNISDIPKKADEFTRFTWTSEHPDTPDGWIDLANSPSAPQPDFAGGDWSCGDIGGCGVVTPAQGAEDDLAFTLVFADFTVEKTFSATATRKRVLRTGDAATPHELAQIASEVQSKRPLTDNTCHKTTSAAGEWSTVTKDGDVWSVYRQDTSDLREWVLRCNGTYYPNASTKDVGDDTATSLTWVRGYDWDKDFDITFTRTFTTLASKDHTFVTEDNAARSLECGEGDAKQTVTVENGVAKLDDFFTGSNSLLTGTIDAEVISKGTAPDAHLEAPTDEHLKLILADSSVAYDSAKALPYKLTSVIGDRVVATMTLAAASTDITLPTISANDTTVKDFILDVTNAYAVEGVATDAGINIPRTDFKLVTRDGESLTDVTTVKAGKSAFICFTQKSPVVVDGTTYPCWCVIQLPFGDPS